MCAHALSIGPQSTRRITIQAPDAEVIILTTFDLDEYAFEGVTGRARTFLLKNAGPEELSRGIRAMAAVAQQIREQNISSRTSRPSGWQ